MERWTGMRINELVNSFVVHYFNTFDTDRGKLFQCFRDDSQLICQDSVFMGAPFIISALQALPSQNLIHSITSIDWKVISDGCVVFVCGKQHHPAGQQQPLHFSQVFYLQNAKDVEFYVYRAIYKVHPDGLGAPIP